MRLRILSLALMLCITSALSFAQAPTSTLLRPNWRNFQPAIEEFNIEAPIGLARIGQGDAKSSRKYFGSINGTYLYVFSDPTRSPNNFCVVEGFVKASGHELPRDNKDPVRLIFQDQFGYWQQIVLLESENRLYVAQAVSKDEKDSVANRFISSLTLDLTRIKILDESDISSRNSTPEANLRNSGAGNGASASPVQSPQIKGIKILSRTYATYLDLAKFYQIEGTVVLNVTYLATGKIGNISIVRGLPFGLNDQVIAAVNKMTFEPATQDGVAVDVTKRLEYSFSFY